MGLGLGKLDHWPQGVKAKEGVWRDYHTGEQLKGILYQKIFYRLNLIFWIVMGCGIARFGQRGLKTTET